ncbi:bifunctional (p)ppGpp synthetase/guanosine-3',5'-bis(diphosphate) 3'-pyrophosphohydrolase [Acinetobacter wuhouensis]|uniref:guanosine-3',5'-bis(diphosphate) 3'-diphosphatase n=1 Tax=Acinetobacter wuhouensis TaxID=1879050 RepID=A0A385C0G4_9GAMM|nr:MULTISPECIES: HD domain-containing protein [Acinetobacter]AXQ20994.1 bifunctional (p)ppGpp synthetase/guanosine-3',5'-bis(diphosphate) 3'-pyrophosphohydrolase [Acinetobacter wuhouensis]AYO55821.1 bifunctional (p)ppGpp synthetase/guanosine-3',5'-bis(diphosphate) 3'-pyrophosphohydrolase [Acinetobacter wuhouensis]RZG74352.1 bifunctional (p)ppGpp synthetase/guanosine-3',5'-bis(diphosphate) 3'-pyrophosphohydrolase [Acinetobacter sp. WCHAc060025]RZG88395.1 bifunctional (p)ppGpp synthetase/guanosin
MPGQAVSQAKQQLNIIIDAYLKPSDVERVLVACDYADIAHDGITRKSGEPYILHPIAVSCILAHMRMDAETLMAALLHDVIEDTDFTKEDITEKFGKVVAELVDGVTKLSHSSDKEYNKAASFRKILQATLQDPRVIIIKLADRYHNMTTLGALRPDKRARIAQETFDIFVPMARLVGMNEMADNLEHLCYQNLDLDMYNDVQENLLKTKPERCKYQSVWEQNLADLLNNYNIVGRIKKKNNNIELLRHFVKNEIDLQELTHSHAFEIILQSIADCDRLVEALRENFQVLSYEDHIRRPLPGGNQSLMIRLKGEKTTLSLTIQTELMRKAARFGVVLGENAPQACRSAIQASMKNLDILVGGDCAKTTFSDLLDYLHQEKIWVYTPHGQLHELPQGATAVDFAYSASLFLGNHAVGAKINGEVKPLSTPLVSGQVVEVITDVLATPNPDWLSFINTQKARRAIQNILRDQDIDEQRLVGQQALDRALKLFNRSTKDLSEADWIDLLQWRHVQDKDTLFEQIAVGDLLPQLVANHLFAQSQNADEAASERLIQGTDGVDVKYAHCCNPVLGDPIQGHLSRRGLIVHRERCHNLLHEQHLHPENIMLLHWTSEQEDDVNFNAYLSIDLVLNDEQISELIYLCRKAKTGVESVRSHEGKTYVNIVVNNRKQIAQIIRELRMQFGFPRISRLAMPPTINEPIKAKAC